MLHWGIASHEPLPSNREPERRAASGSLARVSKLLVYVLSAVLAAIHPQDGPHADLRVEILPDRIVEHVAMNLVFLDTFAPTPREKSDDLDNVELPALQDSLARAMASLAPVTVDGVPVPPRIENLRLAAVDPTLLPLFPRSGMRGMRRIEFEAVYPLKQLPTRATIGWSAFPEDLLSTPEQPRYIVLAGELEAEGRRLGIEFTHDKQVVEWQAPKGKPGDELLEVPAPAPSRSGPGAVAWVLWGLLDTACVLVAVWLFRRKSPAARLLATVPLGIAGVAAVLLALRPSSAAPSLTREDAQAAFAPLHANLYRALDYVREGDVYDVLAHSADGPLLEALYRDMRRSLTIEEAGGAVGRVMAVRPIETVVGAIEIVPRKGAAARTEFVVDARWQVDGTVSHWGHRHDRTNEYRARYRVAATDGGWRIVSQDLLDEHRVDQPPAELPPDGPAPPVLPDDGIL